MPDSSFFTSSELRDLYLNQHLSTYDIAEKFGCDPKTVYYWLKKFNIPTRPRKVILINKEKLEKLYESGFSLKEIGNQLGCNASAVLKKFGKFNIKTRTSWENNIIHKKTNFSNDSIEKAYLVGFRTGDLNVRQLSALSSITVKSNTTHLVQVELMKKLFSKYGPVWVGQPKNPQKVFHCTISLNNSFSFLIPRHYSIPNYIMRSRKTFLAFLAGYTDAEGTIRIYNNTARFRIGSYDKNILLQIHNRLLALTIQNTFHLERPAGQYGKLIHNGDFYRVTIAGKTALKLCLTLLLPYLKHGRRRQDAILALQNVQSRLK